MAQTAGAHEKLTVQVLQRTLNLPPEQRRTIEADIQWLDATAAGSRAPAPDPKNPQRYLLVLTDAEQMEISGANNRFASEVHEKCEAQYGGMSQFADPAGRRKAPIDTRVALPDLLNASPTPVERPKVSSASQKLQDCAAAMPALRWQVMAEWMDRRFQAQSNLSPQERTVWEQDIAVVRAAAQSGAATMPQSPDARNPMRYMTRLSTEDQVAMTQDYTARREACTAGVRADLNQQQAARDRARGEEIAARAKAQAAQNAAELQARRQRLSKAERSQIQQQHSAYYNQIMTECNSMDHMGTGSKTQVKFGR